MIAVLPLLISGTVALVMSSIFVVLYKTYPKDIRGLKEWAMALVTLASALPLFMLRGKIPDFLSIVIANLLIILGFYFINLGTRRFHNATEKFETTHIIYIAVFIILFMTFTYVEDNIVVRTVLNSVFTLGILFHLVLFIQSNFTKSTGRNILLVALAIVISSRIIRIETIVFGIDMPTKLFDDSFTQILNLIAPSITMPLATISFIILATERLNQHLNHLSRHDQLTGCLNKQTGMIELNNEISRTKRYQSNLSIMFIDLDNFKKINDELGHLMGDKILIEFTHKTKSCLRGFDILFRFGGDEFVVILPNTSQHQARLVAERIHEIASVDHANSKQSTWTVSIGITEWLGDVDNINSLFSRADKALYEAKLVGKNNTKLN